MKFNIFLFTVLFFLKVNAQSNLKIKIDDRMEALSIFYTLATVDTLDTKPTPSIYYNDVKKYFEPYKNHPSLDWYRNLDTWDKYDMCSMGLFLTDSYPFSVQSTPEITYIKSSPITTFLQYFNKFYKECKVATFLKKHHKEYCKICNSAKQVVTNYSIFKEIHNFYGKSTTGDFVIYIDLLNNHGNNAIPNKTSINRCFRLAYLNDVSKNLTDNSDVNFIPYENIIIHEISHLFLNDFLKNYESMLHSHKSTFLTTTKGEKIEEKEWLNELDELIVRVCTAKIIEQKYGKEMANKEIENQSKRFLHARPVFDYFEKYTNSRNQYKSINDFYNDLANYLKTL